jgi:protein arginine kinase activator
MENIPPEEEPEHPERPLECSECKRPITVHYTEIVGEAYTHTGMCSECPQLQRRLQGAPQEAFITVGKDKTGLVCGECKTTLVDVRVGHTVGCSNCYNVFGDFIIDDLLKSNKISPSITKKRKSIPLHIGRGPGETQEISPSIRLMALNEALEETLKREDYEQAALLRDQIKALTDGMEKDNDKE